MNDESGVAEMIRDAVDAAVKAERERCAAIAQKHEKAVQKEWDKPGDLGLRIGLGLGTCRLGMARQEIERGDAP